jgi:hypothetical protein
MPLFLPTVRFVSVCAVLLVGALVLSAQSPPENFTMPRLKNGRPDLQGLWGGLRRGGNNYQFFESMEYLPSALPIKRELFRLQGNDNLYYWCATASIPTQLVYIPFPFLIFQDNSNVVLLHEYAHDVRIIPTDGSPHPDPREYSGLNGDSRGRWEGDTLVVDTTNFSKGVRRINQAGDFLDENSHIIERFTLIAPDRLQYEVTVDDPTVLARPWKVTDVLVRRPKGDWILDTACREGIQDAASGAAPTSQPN